jgi:hypothetical protein
LRAFSAKGGLTPFSTDKSALVETELEKKGLAPFCPKTGFTIGGGPSEYSPVELRRL